jgi:hypothetical protein
MDAQKAIAAAMSEDELLTHVLDIAWLYKWRRYHVRNSKQGIIQGETGFPDVVLVKRERLLFIELKKQDGRTSPDQRAWIADLLAVPGIETFIWRPSDWLDGTVQRTLARGGVSGTLDAHGAPTA